MKQLNIVETTQIAGGLQMIGNAGVMVTDPYVSYACANYVETLTMEQAILVSYGIISINTAAENIVFGAYYDSPCMFYEADAALNSLVVI